MEPTKSEIKTGLIRERDSGGQSQETPTESWSLKMNRKQPQHSNTTGIWTLSKKYDTRKLYLSQETLTKGTITHKKRLIIKKSKQEIQTQPNNNPKKRSRMAKQKPGIQKWLKTLGPQSRDHYIIMQFSKFCWYKCSGLQPTAVSFPCLL